MKRLICILILFLVSLFHPSYVQAVWYYDGNPVCTAFGDQYYQFMTGGAGGGIIVWEDHRHGYGDIFAQRFDSDGNMLWMSDGVPVCVADRDQIRPYPVDDGSGGAILVWVDDRYGSGYDIFAQRIDPDGNTLWADNGVPVCSAAGEQHRPRMITDGAGGAIISWHDARSGFNHIYAQRIDANGVAQWTDNGVRISDPHPYGDVPQEWAFPAEDGCGGAIISWLARTGEYYSELWTQRIDSSGNTLWDGGGSLVSTEAAGQIFWAYIIPDDVGGAIVAWVRNITGECHDILAQRLAPDGGMLWNPGGQIVASSGGTVEYPVIASDGNNGAFVAWNDCEFAICPIYFSMGCIRRIDASGTPLWDSKKCISDMCKGPHYMSIAPDGEGGVFAAWRDMSTSVGNIWAQRIDPSGLRMWDDSGARVCTASGTQAGACISPAEPGSIFVCWYDYRDHNYDIYVKEVYEGMVIATLLQSSTAAWSSGSIVVSWTVSEYDEGSEFLVLRSEDGGDSWRPIEVAKIVRDCMTFTFTDRELLGGCEYLYRVDVSDDEGDRILFTTEGVSTPEIPLTLQQNYPNPFNPATTLTFYLPVRTDVSLGVYDVTGRLVTTLERGMLEAGYHSANWDGKHLSGRFADSGVYFCRLKAGKETVTLKMILLR